MSAEREHSIVTNLVNDEMRHGRGRGVLLSDGASREERESHEKGAAHHRAAGSHFGYVFLIFRLTEEDGAVRCS